MLSRTMLIGRLGADPEIKHLDSEKNVSTASVATYKSFKKPSGEWDQITEWHRVIVWNRAPSIEKMKKGMMVIVEGENRTRTWDYNGIKRYTTEVVGVMRVMPKTEGHAPTGGNDTTAENTNFESKETVPPPDTTDDLPF